HGARSEQVHRVVATAAVDRAGERDAAVHDEGVVARASDDVADSREASVEPGDLARVGTSELPGRIDVIANESGIAAAIDRARAAQDPSLVDEDLIGTGRLELGEVLISGTDVRYRPGIARRDARDGCPTHLIQGVQPGLAAAVNGSRHPGLEVEL